MCFTPSRPSSLWHPKASEVHRRAVLFFSLPFWRNDSSSGCHFAKLHLCVHHTGGRVQIPCILNKNTHDWLSVQVESEFILESERESFIEQVREVIENADQKGLDANKQVNATFYSLFSFWVFYQWIAVLLALTLSLGVDFYTEKSLYPVKYSFIP